MGARGRCGTTYSEVRRLLGIIDGSAPASSGGFLRLSLVSSLITSCRRRRFPVRTPSLISIVGLHVCRVKLARAGLSRLLGMDPSQVDRCLSKGYRPALGITHRVDQGLGVSTGVILKMWIWIFIIVCFEHSSVFEFRTFFVSFCSGHFVIICRLSA